MRFSDQFETAFRGNGHALSDEAVGACALLLYAQDELGTVR